MTVADFTSDTVTMFGFTIADAVLFAALGSLSLAVTVAVFVIGDANGLGALTVIVTVDDAPFASGAPAHTTPGAVTLTARGGGRRIRDAGGSVSVSAYPEDLPGPLLVTVSVYVIAPPGSTIDGLADFVSARSVLKPGALVPSLFVLAGPA